MKNTRKTSNEKLEMSRNFGMGYFLVVHQYGNLPILATRVLVYLYSNCVLYFCLGPTVIGSYSCGDPANVILW